MTHLELLIWVKKCFLALVSEQWEMSPTGTQNPGVLGDPYHCARLLLGLLRQDQSPTPTLRPSVPRTQQP